LIFILYKIQANIVSLGFLLSFILILLKNYVVLTSCHTPLDTVSPQSKGIAGQARNDKKFKTAIASVAWQSTKQKRAYTIRPYTQKKS